MHFWIDKRSPQCGFGRSRVAASLHTGGSGLSFGHPPRRSGGHKSSSSSTANSSLSAASNTSIQVHRQQHHHHQNQQQASGTQYHAHAATTSNNTQYRNTNYPSITVSNNNNNSNNAASNGTNRNFVRPNVTSSHHYHNNNRQHGVGNHLQQLPSSGNCVVPNSSNNNHSNSSGTAQSLVSPTGNNFTTSLNNSTITNSTSTHHPHAQRYRHPQFGNMSVRTYHPTVQQPQQQQQQISIATTTSALPHLQQLQTQTQLQQSTTNITTTANTMQHNTMGTGATITNQLQQSLDTLNEHGIHQSCNQTANLTVELYQQHQTSPRTVSTYNRNLPATTMSPPICDYNNASPNLRTTYTNSTLTSTTATTNHQYHYHNQSQHSRQRRTARSIESSDLQFLPLHLKCGIFASLVLAIAFIVGIKVYFDNHGTKFEVGLFWLLTATFVFAFCFVSICKVPRVLFASAASSRSNSRDQTRERCSMDEAGGHSSMVNSMDDAVITGLHEFQHEQIQSININAQAGPPPYHIAILLPETKAKEDINALEESPPPSYDKILI